MRIYNKNFQLDRRKELRNNQTKAEIILWEKLRRRQIGGYKFRRQYGIDEYIVDFYCAELKLIVEVDGGYHDEKEIQSYDMKRDGYLTSLGLKIIRFKNEEVLNSCDEVVEKLKKELHPSF